MHLPEPLIAAEVPRWIWAALVMAAFAGVTALTILLARYPVRRVPPPVVGSAPGDDETKDDL